MRLLNIVLATTILTGAGAAVASVDTSPKPGGVYRLKPGIYVRKDTACASAPNAAIRQYDGRGISTPHTRACRARILSRRGDRYEVTQSCIDAGAGPAPRFVERQTVAIRDALTFTIKTRGPSVEYRYCPAYMLPAGMRATAR
jgi:hypothetical protein